MTFDRITLDPAQCDGRPCIRGMRIPVQLILQLLADGRTSAEVMTIYPQLEPADITQALEFALRRHKDRKRHQLN